MSDVKPRTKAQIIGGLADEADLTKKQVTAVLDAMNGMIKKDLGRKGAGVFSIPALCKITVTKKPATKARKGINPFTGEEAMFKAKPARKVVKLRALKALRDMV